MIQELFGGAGLLGAGDRKFSFHGAVLEGLPSSSSLPSYPLPSSTTTNSTTTTTTTTTTTPTPCPENLRCPRCDSPNTKFCYYNNYNLTQPRYFCKTCRRYWTKGGALRNVPIGGGCRKNKSTIVSTSAGKSTAGKAKPVSSDAVKLNLGSVFEQEQPTNPILWGSPQNSQLLALLRATPNPNPNSTSISNFVDIKNEGHMIGSQGSSESSAVTAALNAKTLGLDPLGQVPIGLYSSFFRNNQQQLQQQQNQHHQQQQQQNMSVHGDLQNTGIQEFYQRLKASVNYYPDHSSAAMNNNVNTSMSSSASTIMDQAPTTAGDFNCWNPPFSWSNSDLPATNGAFH